jgi:hypothetical protein
MGFPWRKMFNGIETFAPLVLAGTPAAPFVTPIIKGIMVAEAAQKDGDEKLSGADKLNLAVAEVKTALSAGGVDPALTDEAIAHSISAVVDTVKIKDQLHEKIAAAA